MRRPLLSIFADGLRFDSIQFMPFVKSLNSVPLETVLGYSITCHPSMYTGFFPDKHKIVFHWVMNQKKYGPYFLLSYFPHIFPFSIPYVQAVISHFYAKIFLKRKANSFMGYGKILNLPMTYWDKLDINEIKYWDEDNYINEDIKTIFELVRQENLKYHISKLHKPNSGQVDEIKIVKPEGYDWIYYFIGEIDHISHLNLQDSIKGKQLLMKIDEFIKRRYTEFLNIYGELGFDFIFWSDHGHIPVKKRYNLYKVFNDNNLNLCKLFHIIDSTTVRFWIESEIKKKNVINVMTQIPEAHLVDDNDFNKLHLPHEKYLYGDLFYFLDGGSIFTHTIHGFGLESKSMHGYHPLENGNEGAFVSNRNITTDKATLPDIFVTSINCLGIKYESPIPLDGRVILS